MKPNMRIFKYELQITDEQIVRMPKAPHPLRVGEQNGVLVMWALIDKNSEMTDHRVFVVGTGNPIEFDLGNKHYVGTVQESRRPLVWHVFIELPELG